MNQITHTRRIVALTNKRGEFIGLASLQVMRPGEPITFPEELDLRLHYGRCLFRLVHEGSGGAAAIPTYRVR